MKLLMKTSLVGFMMLVLTFPIIAQQINPSLYSNTWRDNETKVISGNEITKIFGQLPNNPYTYNVSPITAVGYITLDTIESNFKKVAKVENWSAEALDENINSIKKTSTGGQIQVYLSRYEEERANFQWFFLIIRGIDDKEKLWEYKFPYKAPQVPVNNGWWNYTTVEIPIDLPSEFYIYLNDRKSGFLSDFKFLVETE